MPLFPDSARSGDIHFVLARGLPYRPRMLAVAGLVASGLAVQWTLNVYAGLALMAAGTALSLIHGYCAKPEVSGDEEWAQVTPDEYQRVRLRQKDLARWDLDCFDITNPLGFFSLALLAAGTVLAAVWMAHRGWETLTRTWIADACVLLLPHWVTGVRTYLRKDRLVIKIELLEKMLALLAGHTDVQGLPMLSTQPTAKGRVPSDARLMAHMINGPEGFMGIQIQVSINQVQGTDYPYLYCVLLAKKGSGLFNKLSVIHPAPSGIVVEPAPAQDVEVLVVRQKTTKTSGYCTRPAAAAGVVEYALTLARGLAR